VSKQGAKQRTTASQPSCPLDGWEAVVPCPIRAIRAIRGVSPQSFLWRHFAVTQGARMPQPEPNRRKRRQQRLLLFPSQNNLCFLCCFLLDLRLRTNDRIQVRFGEGRRNQDVRRVRSSVVIWRQSSKFAGATVPGFYAGRDCPRCIHTHVAACAGSTELDRRTCG